MIVGCISSESRSPSGFSIQKPSTADAAEGFFLGGFGKTAPANRFLPPSRNLPLNSVPEFRLRNWTRNPTLCDSPLRRLAPAAGCKLSPLDKRGRKKSLRTAAQDCDVSWLNTLDIGATHGSACATNGLLFAIGGQPFEVAGLTFAFAGSPCAIGGFVFAFGGICVRERWNVQTHAPPGTPDAASTLPVEPKGCKAK